MKDKKCKIKTNVLFPFPSSSFRQIVSRRWKDTDTEQDFCSWTEWSLCKNVYCTLWCRNLVKVDTEKQPRPNEIDECDLTVSQNPYSSAEGASRTTWEGYHWSLGSGVDTRPRFTVFLVLEGLLWWRSKVSFVS